MAIISRTLIDEYNGHGFAAQYSKYANNAKNDENNNSIADTYATKDELNHVAPSGATPTSSLTCTGADTFAWAGWTKSTVSIPPAIKRYLCITYRGYWEGINLIPPFDYGVDISSFLGNPEYSNLKTFTIPNSTSSWDDLYLKNDPSIMSLWNQDKDFTIETIFHTNGMTDYSGIGWSRRGFSSGGSPRLVKSSSFQVIVRTSGVVFATFKDFNMTERATLTKAISLYQWHHIAITYEASSKNCTVFIDGKNIGSLKITWSHETEETFTACVGSSTTQLAIYDYVAYKDDFTVPTIPHIYNDEYALKT